MAPYEPIPVRPLRLRGVFGITWEIYKRCWLVSALYSLFYVTIIFLLVFTFIYPVAMHWANELVRISSVYNIRPGDIIRILGGVISVLSVTTLTAAAIQLLLTPIYTGAMYSQMELRLRGGLDSLGGMLSKSGQMFKRFFSASLAKGLIGAGFAAGAGILFSILLSASVLIAALSRDTTGAVGVVLISAAVMFGMIFLNCFIAFTLPAAASEGLRGFKAVGRSFKLASKKIWRIFGCTLIVSVCFTIVQVAIGYIAVRLGLWEQYPQLARMFIMLALEAVVFALCAPYMQALNTVLYHDARARAGGQDEAESQVSYVSRAQTLPSGAREDAERAGEA